MMPKELDYDDDKLLETYQAIDKFKSSKEYFSNLRLGQFLMNELKPTEINAEIFYEKDEIVAMVKFFETYCVSKEVL